MQFCQSHWDKLRAAVKERGMDELVSSSGKEVVDRMARESKGEETLASFDPLMSLHWAIVNRLTDIGGAGVLLAEGCPMCFANQQHVMACKEPNCVWSFDNWISGCADLMKSYAIELGWKREVN